MDLDPKNRASMLTYEAPDLAGLLRLIRAGHAESAAELHRILSPGVRFLLQRRLGRDNIDDEAQSVLEAAISCIRTDISVQPDGLPRMVRQLIQQQYAGQSGPSRATGTGTTGGPGVEVAERILERMSPVERDALRRCYVLGEAPESFLETLRVTPEEFRAIRSRARAEFSSKNAKANVA